MKTDFKTILHFVKNFRLNSIFIRNFILITLIMLLPLTVVGTLFYVNTRTSIDGEIALITQHNVSIAKNAVDNIIRTAGLLANQTSLNQDVEKLCLSYYNDGNISWLYQDVRSYISDFTHVYPYIHSTYVYCEKNNVLLDNQGVFQFDDYEDTDWFSLYEKSLPKETIVTHRKMDGHYPIFISVIRSITVNGTDKIGCVVINLDVEQLNEVLSDIESAQLQDTLLLDGEGRILLGRDLTRIGDTLTNYLGDGSGAASLSADTGTLQLASGKYLYAQTSSYRYGLTYIALIPRTHFNDLVSGSFGFLGIMLFFLIIAGLAVAMLISIRTYAPIQRILDALMPSSQDLDAIGAERANEITYITNTVKSTIDRNYELAEELNYRMLLLNQAQVYALQMQVNPHFLNNTLESINWTAIHQLGEKNKISEMIKSLSALFDISLDNEHYLIPIEEELHHTNIYTYIISLKYGSDLNFIWDIEENISSYKIIKLTLQPILENAVVHGISQNHGKGEIYVRARFHKDGILITVSDNGAGMDARQLAELQASLSTDALSPGALSGRHLGLKNVNQRIKLIFGEHYGVTISSEKNNGTTVNVFIPKTIL